MRKIEVFLLGLTARGLSWLAGLLGDWLLGKLADGGLVGLDLLYNLIDFVDWLMDAVAEQLCGPSRDPQY